MRGRQRRVTRVLQRGVTRAGVVRGGRGRPTTVPQRAARGQNQKQPEGDCRDGGGCPGAVRGARAGDAVRERPGA